MSDYLISLTPHVEGQDVEFIPFKADDDLEAIEILQCYRNQENYKDFFKFRLYRQSAELTFSTYNPFRVDDKT